MLVIATPDTLGVRQMAEHARLLNPGIEIVVRSHNEEEARRLEDEVVRPRLRRRAWSWPRR